MFLYSCCCAASGVGYFDNVTATVRAKSPYSMEALLMELFLLFGKQDELRTE